MTKKEEKVKRLWEKGIRDPALIARKTGNRGNALTAATNEVREIIARLKLH